MKELKRESQSQIQQNWGALKKIVEEHFKLLRAQHPGWIREDLLDQLGLPCTALMVELAGAAGFTCKAEAAADEIVAVLGQHMSGIHSAETIAQQTGVGAQKVRRILETCRGGYGQTPYGIAPYGNRAVSDGKSTVTRRITVKGQLSYRGHRYSLGAKYRGRTVHVRERDRELLITCNDRSPLHVTRYPTR